ncbi:MAG: cytochrome C oxidase subunit IV family protein [Myxococcales bacterium]|nr:cytochrome C oxidase subunit IV family protein [Myxococcales bacterium]
MKANAIHRGAWSYGAVWLSLLGFTFLTFFAAKVDLGTWNIGIALAIASAKSALVVMFFMHLRTHAATNRAFFALAVVFVGLLASLTLADLATRLPTARPGHPALPPLGAEPRGR